MNCGCYILKFKNCCGNGIRNRSSHISIMRFLLPFYYRFYLCALLKKHKVVKTEKRLPAFSIYFKCQCRLVVKWAFSFIHLYNKADIFAWFEQIADGQWFWFASLIKHRYLSSFLIPSSKTSNDAASWQNWITSKPIVMLSWNSWCYLVIFRSKLWSHCQ